MNNNINKLHELDIAQKIGLNIPAHAHYLK
jgi:hypothetical protein